MVSVYADLPGMRASDSPQTTIPPSLLITPYRPDIVIYNQINNSVTLLELILRVPWTQSIILNLLEIVSRGRQNTSKFCQDLIVWEFPVPTIQLNYYTIELLYAY